jgi:nucleotide-binding universal stress UspA family protein
MKEKPIVMKKILVAQNGIKYSAAAVEYAVNIAKVEDALLVGLFIHDLSYANLSYGVMWDMPYVDFNMLSEINKDDDEKIKLNISLFKSACDKAGVKHRVHLEQGVPLQELIKESSFADLILIDVHTGFFSFKQETPSPFLKDVLADAHCPVLIVPDSHNTFEKVIFSYDGSASSSYALKMFSYIFPKHADNETIILTVNKDNSNHIEENKNIKELASTRLTSPNYVVLNGEPEVEILNYLKTFGHNAVVVLGSYGRSAISRLFNESLSNKLLREIQLPLFITHL